jgi:carboxyl-terminal processing protease
VGAVLGKNNHDGRLYVREAPADMGAAKAGVQPGDEVTAIDGHPVSALSPDEVHKALAGSVGSKVKLTVARNGQTLSFEIERGPLRGE